MSVEEFQVIVEKIRPYTDYIYLHVLGEPLIHPEFDEILKIASSHGFFVNITTNGSRLNLHKESIMLSNVRQINISLHDAEENIDKLAWDDYLKEMLDFSVFVSGKIYVSLRLWNINSSGSEGFNDFCLEKISERFNISTKELLATGKGNGVKLFEHIFFQTSPRFQWPNLDNPSQYSDKTCYAMKDHLAVLSDGNVVPCCLDADAHLSLGNIFTQNIEVILNNPRAINIKRGFEQRKVVEPLCATCGFIID